MVALSLFELHIVRQLKELLGHPKAVRAGLPTYELPGHILTLVVISLYNIYSLALLNAAIWPDLHLSGISELAMPWKYYFQAVMYSLILFLSAVVGERNKSAAELAVEKDDELVAKLLSGPHPQGGRNVVKARQVLSTDEAAAEQEWLLTALEGGDPASVPMLPFGGD